MHQHPYVHVWEDSERGRWNAAFGIRLTACPLKRETSSGEGGTLWRYLQDQADLINSLFCPEPPRAFAVRYIAHPHPSSFSAGRVEAVLLAKVEAKEKSQSRERAESLCEELVALLAGRMPDYEWSIVGNQENFDRFWSPFDWEQADVVEIRQREDLVLLETVRPRPALGRGRSLSQPSWDLEKNVYFVHPFIPRPSTLVSLLRMLLFQRAPVLFQAAISPVWLQTEEEEALTTEIGKCEQYAQRREALAAGGVGASETIHEARASALCQGLLSQLLRLQDAPFLVSITLASPERLPRSLAEAVGVEVTLPVGDESSGAPSALAQLGAGGYDIAVPETEVEKKVALENVRSLAFEHWGTSLAPERLRRIRWLVDAHGAAGAFRFPVAVEEGLPGLELRTARIRPLPRQVALLGENAAEGDTLLLGENPHLGLREPVFLTERDRRQHVHIVGQTGTGKTTLLKTMVVEDMKAGRGLCVIDPHGDLFDELLGYVPPERIGDVVVLDPTDTQFPIGLNMLESSTEEQRYFVVREMRAIMERLIGDQFQSAATWYAGPIFYQHMQMNMLLVMSNPNDPGTLLEFYEIFQHKDYWRRWLPLRWSDPRLERWTKETLPNIDYTKRSADGFCLGEYLSSKFEDFVFDPKLRLMFGQKRSTINFRRIMDEGKILLVNLAKGELTEANARFLGMVLMAKFFAAAMERSAIPPEQRRAFYQYVDEFQSIATESFVLLLSEARKFGLGLVLANQFVSQIKDERIIQAIFGNVGTLVAFRTGRADAELLAPHFSPAFDYLDLTNLPNWHACMKATVNGQVVPPFSIHTVLPAGTPDADVANRVRKTSRRNYGRKRGEVEKEIQRSLQDPRVEEPATDEANSVFDDWDPD